MTAITTEKELKKMIKKLKNNPKDLDLINQIAIGYFENPSMLNDNDDLKFFELAYSTKKTIKSTHNLAWILYFEWDEQDRAIEIQKECIELKPKSYYPYYLYGYMLQDQKKYKDAIIYLDKAFQIEPHRDCLHNIGYCYFQIKEFHKAKELFTLSTTDLDLENRSLYNLALTEWELCNTEEVKRIADELFQRIKTNVHEAISGYEIGLLYFLLNDFQRTSDCLVKQGMDGIDLWEWDYLSYSHYTSDIKSWTEQVLDSIKKRNICCDKIESNHEAWSDYSKEEKIERLMELSTEIKNRQDTLINGVIKPIPDIAKSIVSEYCHCLLYDCKRHGNPSDDE